MWLHYIICQQTNNNFNDENNENRMELWKWKSNEKKHITNIIWENILILTKRNENDEIMHRGNIKVKFITLVFQNKPFLTELTSMMMMMISRHIITHQIVIFVVVVNDKFQNIKMLKQTNKLKCWSSHIEQKNKTKASYKRKEEKKIVVVSNMNNNKGKKRDKIENHILYCLLAFLFFSTSDDHIIMFGNKNFFFALTFYILSDNSWERVLIIFAPWVKKNQMVMIFDIFTGKKTSNTSKKIKKTNVIISFQWEQQTFTIKKRHDTPTGDSWLFNCSRWITASFP